MKSTKILNMFKIIAAFASVKNYKKDKINVQYIEDVVASTTLYTKDIDFSKLNQLIKLLGENTLITHNKKLIVINVGFYTDYRANILINNDRLKLIDFSIYLLLKNISVTYKDIFDYKREIAMIEKYKMREANNDKLEGRNSYKIDEEQLLNLNYLLKLDIIKLLFEEENLNSLSIEYDLIFIFNNITWRNIVTLFKLKGINLYGGSSNRRHLLSTVQAQLTTFLLLLNDLKLNKHLIYHSFKIFSNFNNNIERYLLEKINTKVSFEEILELKRLEPESEKYFVSKHNLLMNFTLTLMNLKKNIEISNYEKLELEKTKSEKEIRLKELIGGSYSGQLREKKLRNTHKAIEELNLKLKEQLDNITKFEKEIKDITSYLYNVDTNLFYENGEFKLNRSIKLSQENNLMDITSTENELNNIET